MLTEFVFVDAQFDQFERKVDGPFFAVLIADVAVSHRFREAFSRWLVENNCRYMMAWGADCSLWDDSVDLAVLERFDFGDIPDEEDVITTWHERESIYDVFEFALMSIEDADIEANRLVIFQVGNSNRTEFVKAQFEGLRSKSYRR